MVNFRGGTSTPRKASPDMVKTSPSARLHQVSVRIRVRFGVRVSVRVGVRVRVGFRLRFCKLASGEPNVMQVPLSILDMYRMRLVLLTLTLTLTLTNPNPNPNPNANSNPNPNQP